MTDNGRNTEERRSAVHTLLDVWDVYTCSDVAPHLTCRELEAVAGVFLSHGETDKHDALIESHRDSDEYGDLHYHWTAAKVLEELERLPEDYQRCKDAAVEAYREWVDKGDDVLQPPPAGWIGGQVRNAMPDYFDDRLGHPDDEYEAESFAEDDPTGAIGALFYDHAKTGGA